MIKKASHIQQCLSFLKTHPKTNTKFRLNPNEQSYLRVSFWENNSLNVEIKAKHHLEIVKSFYADQLRFNSLLQGISYSQSTSKNNKISKKVQRRHLKRQSERESENSAPQQKYRQGLVNSMSLTDPNLYILMINEKSTLADAVGLFNRIVNSPNINMKEFEENVWKKYSYYIYLIGEKYLIKTSKEKEQQVQSHTPHSSGVQDNHSLARQKKQQKLRLAFFDTCTQIHQKFKGKLVSQNTTKVYNRFADHFTQHAQWRALTLEQKLVVLLSLSRYNLKKCTAIFLGRKHHLLSELKNLIYRGNASTLPSKSTEIRAMTHHSNIQTIESLFKLMTAIGHFDTQLIELCVEDIYHEVNTLSLNQIKSLLFFLGSSHKYVNRDLLDKFIQRVQSMLPSLNEGHRIDVLHLLSSFSTIERNLRHSTYYENLDSLYSKVLPFVVNCNLKLYKSKYFAIIATVLRRSQHFDETMLKNIIGECMSRKVLSLQDTDLNENQNLRKMNPPPPEFEFSHISIPQLSTLFHCLSSFNYADKNFVEYYIELLGLISSSPAGRSIIPRKQFGRIVWSVCVLCTPKQFDKIFPLIEYFYRSVSEESQKAQVSRNRLSDITSDARTIYLCYLLLGSRYPNSEIQYENKLIQKYYIEGPKHQIQSSETQKEIYNTLVEMGVPCILEYNLKNIICDIYIPKLGNEIEHVIVEVHGYQHFARNVNRINGKTRLKEKIIENEGYLWSYIALEEWLIADDKQQFLRVFLEQGIQRKFYLRKKRLEEASSQNRLETLKVGTEKSNDKLSQRRRRLESLERKTIGRRVKAISSDHNIQLQK